MTAWSIANYIDGVAEAGKAVYDIPMYINVWLMEQREWSMAGSRGNLSIGRRVFVKCWISTSGSHRM